MSNLFKHYLNMINEGDWQEAVKNPKFKEFINKMKILSKLYNEIEPNLDENEIEEVLKPLDSSKFSDSDKKHFEAILSSDEVKEANTGNWMSDDFDWSYGINIINQIYNILNKYKKS